MNKNRNKNRVSTRNRNETTPLLKRGLQIRIGKRIGLKKVRRTP